MRMSLLLRPPTLTVQGWTHGGNIMHAPPVSTSLPVWICDLHSALQACIFLLLWIHIYLHLKCPCNMTGTSHMRCLSVCSQSSFVSRPLHWERMGGAGHA